MNRTFQLAALALALATLSGCGSVKVTYTGRHELSEIGVIKAQKTDEGFKCPSAINILPEPLAPGESYTVRGLLPGRYCVNGRQTDVPIIGQVEVFITWP